MKRLADAIHDLGLKFGIYSTPWKGTYEGHIGSTCDRVDGVYEWAAAGDCNEYFRIGRSESEWQAKRRENYGFGRHSFLKNDVRQWVEWGVDYLKYDWKPIDVPHVKEVYQIMRESGRDIFLSLSNKAPYWQAKEWATYANAWRTTGDIEDTWESVKAIGFSQDRWSWHSGPGHWNDPDMLVLGHVGWGPSARPTRLTAEEQRSHFSLWCLLAAPLLLGCDIARLDPATLALLTNEEVLAIDQDPLGQQGVRVAGDQQHQVIVKLLEDGSLAVGMFNLSDRDERLTLHWDDLLIAGSSRQVRDLWTRSEEGVYTESFAATVPAHGVKLLRLSESIGPQA
jgi:alpha-galactosidase